MDDVGVRAPARTAAGSRERLMGKLRVGLTGGIGAGKSAVAELFAGWGATIIDGDVLARDVLAPGSEGIREVAQRWPQVIGRDGDLDRAALAAIVFVDEAARRELNAIVHPLVVHVVPLLFEGDFWRACERTVLVTAPRDVRIERVVARGGNRDDVERRMAAQIDPTLARTRADYTIENDGDREQLRERSRAVYDALVEDLDAKEAP
jgi:dephospho-CoA kinase